jgi:hypothetical protein
MTYLGDTSLANLPSALDFRALELGFEADSEPQGFGSVSRRRAGAVFLTVEKRARKSLLTAESGSSRAVKKSWKRLNESEGDGIGSACVEKLNNSQTS